jgi:hypothetical protein
VPRTPEVLECLGVLQARFPDAELGRLLVPENLIIG